MQNLLPKAAPAEVTTEPSRYCEVLGQGDGYNPGPAHLFQAGVSLENIPAIYQT